MKSVKFKKMLKKNKKNPEFQEIYGFHSVFSALQNKERQHFNIYIIEKYQSFVKKYSNKIQNINILTNKEMAKLFGNESVTQGIVMQSSPLISKKFEDLFEKTELQENSVIVALDQITDPNNIGSIMRSCVLFNCKTIIASKDHSPTITPGLSKSSSGAIEIINYVKVINLNRSLQKLKKVGYWIYGFDSNAKTNLQSLDLPKKSVFVFGSEGKGIRDLIKKQCDFIISLESKPNKTFGIDSLNVSNACAIALYEHFKKHN
tara:strand:+ start:190 stop:972 length:783 start_codon:yes stop_codon:yes gene_type:complete